MYKNTPTASTIEATTSTIEINMKRSYSPPLRISVFAGAAASFGINDDRIGDSAMFFISCVAIFATQVRQLRQIPVRSLSILPEEMPVPQYVKTGLRS